MKTSFCQTFSSLPAFNFYQSKIEGKKVDIRKKKVNVVALGIFVGIFTFGLGGYLAARLLATHYTLKKLHKMADVSKKTKVIHPDLKCPPGFLPLSEQEIKIVDDFVAKTNAKYDEALIQEMITKKSWFNRTLVGVYNDLLLTHFPQLGFGYYWFVSCESMCISRGILGVPPPPNGFFTDLAESEKFPGFTIDKGMIIFPISWGEPEHSSVVSIDIDKKTITSYDSSWLVSDKKKEEQLKKIRTWFHHFRKEIGKELDVENWDIQLAKNLPRQRTNDCVIFSMVFSKFLAEGRDLKADSFSPDHIKYFRYLFAYELIQKKLR